MFKWEVCIKTLVSLNQKFIIFSQYLILLSINLFCQCLIVRKIVWSVSNRAQTFLKAIRMQKNKRKNK